MWHNPDLRYLCSLGGQALEIRYLGFMVRQSFWSTHEAKDIFCSRPHPEYPWAKWVCDPKASSLNLPDGPSSVTIETINPAAPPRKLTALPDFPTTVSSDGTRVYRIGDKVVVVTPEGDRVECDRDGKYLRCGGDGDLPEGLAISYSFWTDPNAIELRASTMAIAARGYFRSVVR